jgi:hypothetical protein
MTQNDFKASKIVQFFLWLTAIGIIAYWVSYFTDGTVHSTAEECYHIFERNFPAPDGMIALCAMATAIGLGRAREWSVYTGMTAVGGLLFLALIDIAYNVWNDMYFDMNEAMVIETIINIFCLGVAAMITRYLWVNRQLLRY